MGLVWERTQAARRSQATTGVGPEVTVWPSTWTPQLAPPLATHLIPREVALGLTRMCLQPQLCEGKKENQREGIIPYKFFLITFYWMVTGGNCTYHDEHLIMYIMDESPNC